MKALVLQEYNKFVYTDVPLPEIGPNDVLVRIEACGICGSDVHGMDGSTGRRRPPIIMGHEASGVIADTGAAVTRWKKDDRVTFDSTIYPRDDWFTRRGMRNLSDGRRVLGVSCEDYRRDGAFAEYVAVPEHIVYRLPDNLTFEQAAMVEPVSVAVHAVDLTPIRLGDTAVVVGAGMIGLLVIQAARAAGCGRVIAVDVDEQRLSLAKTLGAAVVLRSGGDVVKETQSLTGGRGADVAFEVVGITPTVKTAIESVRRGGAVTLVGNLSPTVELPLQAVVTRQVTLHGSCASSGEYPACLNLIASGAIRVDEMIGAVAPLSEGDAWFHRLYNKEPGLMKVILKP